MRLITLTLIERATGKVKETLLFQYEDNANKAKEFLEGLTTSEEFEVIKGETWTQDINYEAMPS